MTLLHYPHTIRASLVYVTMCVCAQVCEFLHGDNTTLVWDNEQQVPFAYKDDQWVGFDDERSLKTKVDNYPKLVLPKVD